MALDVPSVDAERSVRLLMHTLAHHRRTESALRSDPAVRGRLTVLASAAASRQVVAQGTLLRLVSIAEAFTATQLVLRIEPHAPPPRTPILEDIYSYAEDRAIGNWYEMERRYSTWLRISLKKRSGWSDLKILRDARNAVAHGVGELTRRQARKSRDQLLSSLNQLGMMVVRGTTLYIGEDTLKRAAEVCRDYVFDLDQELLRYDSYHPNRRA
jgi:hypothetical protein